MALLHSDPLKPGTPAPFFELPSVDEKKYSLHDFKGKPLAVLFICNHCPYVKAVEDRILQLVRDYEKRGVAFAAICSNDPTDYPDDSPASLKARWLEKKYGFPYLIDASQDTARAFGAVCTPDIFVYDKDHTLAYRGQIDNSWKDPLQVTRHDLREALDALLAGNKPSPQQIPSMGCSIKWSKTSKN